MPDALANAKLPAFSQTIPRLPVLPGGGSMQIPPRRSELLIPNRPPAGSCSELFAQIEAAAAKLSTLLDRLLGKLRSMPPAGTSSAPGAANGEPSSASGSWSSQSSGSTLLTRLSDFLRDEQRIKEALQRVDEIVPGSASAAAALRIPAIAGLAGEALRLFLP